MGSAAVLLRDACPPGQGMQSLFLAQFFGHKMRGVYCVLGKLVSRPNNKAEAHMRFAV